MQKIASLAVCVILLFVYQLQAGETPVFIELQPAQRGLSSVTAFSPDGKKVVTIDIAPDPRNTTEATIRLWDVESGSANFGKDAMQPVGWYPYEGDERKWFTFIIFSPDGKKLAVANYEGVVKILDIDSGKILQELKGHEAPLNSIAFSPDGKKLVTASNDKTARIWDIESERELKKLEGHTGFVLSAAFSPDGKEVLTTGSNKRHGRSTIFNYGTVQETTEAFEADDDGTARIWNADPDSADFGKELKQLKLYNDGDMMTSAAISPDWKKIVVGQWVFVGGTREYHVRVFDVDSGRVLIWLDVNDAARAFNGIPSFTFSPDGRTVVMAEMEDRNVRIYDVELGREVQRFGNGFSTRVIFSPDGRKIIGRGLNRIGVWDMEALLRQ